MMLRKIEGYWGKKDWLKIRLLLMTQIRSSKNLQEELTDRWSWKNECKELEVAKWLNNKCCAKCLKRVFHKICWHEWNAVFLHQIEQRTSRFTFKQLKKVFKIATQSFLKDKMFQCCGKENVAYPNVVCKVSL